MPADEYETRTDSVLAWKKAQKLGRFDPDAPSIEQQKILASEREIEERGKQHVSLLIYTLCTPIPLPISVALYSCESNFTLHPRGVSEIVTSQHWTWISSKASRPELLD